MTFFFNVNFNNQDNVMTGSGSDKNHLNVMMSSNKLMENCQRDGVFHVDGT